MAPNFFHFRQAIRCSLQGLRPVDAKADSHLSEWSTTTTAFFRSLVVDHRLYTAFTDVNELRLDLDICVNSVPVVAEDTLDNFIFQEKFAESGIGFMEMEVPDVNDEKVMCR